MKVDGHVLAPLLTTMRRQEVKFPKGWSAMTKLRPSWNDQRVGIEKCFKDFSERVAGWDNASEGVIPEFRVRWDRVEKEFQREGGDACPPA